MLKEKKISYHLVQFVQTTKLKKNKTWASFMINTDVCAVTTDKPWHSFWQSLLLITQMAISSTCNPSRPFQMHLNDYGHYLSKMWACQIQIKKITGHSKISLYLVLVTLILSCLCFKGYVFELCHDCGIRFLLVRIF